jgi:hypothetical protein
VCVCARATERERHSVVFVVCARVSAHIKADFVVLVVREIAVAGDSVHVSKQKEVHSGVSLTGSHPNALVHSASIKGPLQMAVIHRPHV